MLGRHCRTGIVRTRNPERPTTMENNDKIAAAAIVGVVAIALLVMLAINAVV